MSPLTRLTHFAARRPRLILVLALLVTGLALLGTTRIRVDTDPENMLEPDQPDRVVYDRMKRDFGLSDLIVVGILDGRGVFAPESLERIAGAITRITQIPGVIAEDVVSLTTTSAARSSGGLVVIRPVLEEVPRGPEGIARIRQDIAADPFLREKIASTDGMAVAIYVPIRSKDQSFRIAERIRAILADDLLPGQTVHVAGLPVAEDTFGREMFIQMALVAPLAFIGILLIVRLLFGESLVLVPVALIAVLSIVWTMGALIGTGHTVHIMSSMIPVFLMPIAILDAVHVLSEYRDRGACSGPSGPTAPPTPADPPAAADSPAGSIVAAIATLERPMLFTSITSAVGFASLALAPIPPVRVFGLFVALGIGIAWLLTLTLLPALFAVLPFRREAEGASRRGGSRLGPILRWVGSVALERAPIVLAAGILLILVGLLGVSRLKSDDNPVRWFRPGHPIRLADDALNERFGGTYMANLCVEGVAARAVDRPEFVRFVERVQRRLERDPDVGKTSSVADIVRRLNRVLNDDDPAQDRIPDGPDAIGQLLFIFQGSGDPNDLDNFVDRDARQANVWVQMKSGDNVVMERVENDLAAFLIEEPPPDGVRVRWSGLNHINRVWQELMVTGMARAVAGSFVVVFLLMALEFRSWRFGALAMIPLTTAIVLSYGVVGLSGKRYDMPVAVCSSLSLGLAVDFAIHFLERWRVAFAAERGVVAANEALFGAPARAIARNAIVVSIGFLPLLASTLTPYVTVSLFFASIMIASALATLLLLPAILRFAGSRIAA